MSELFFCVENSDFFLLKVHKMSRISENILEKENIAEGMEKISIKVSGWNGGRTGWRIVLGWEFSFLVEVEKSAGTWLGLGKCGYVEGG